ncbi:hypothetical protein Tco_1403374 [Tanacetum coccineum]
MDHVSPYMDDVEHVNGHCTSQGIEATERSLSSQLGGQVVSCKPRPTKTELGKTVAYSLWLNESVSIKGVVWLIEFSFRFSTLLGVVSLVQSFVMAACGCSFRSWIHLVASLQIGFNGYRIQVEASKL